VGKSVREIQSFRINNTAAVFLGTVERQEIREMHGVQAERFWSEYRLVTIRVTEVFRGEKEEKFEVVTGLWGGDCGFDFETGESYLIYADPGQQGRLATSSCSATTLADFAGPNLRILRGQPPVADDLLDEASYWKKFHAEHLNSVCGRISRTDGQRVHAGLTLSRERHDGFPPKGYPRNDSYAEPNPDGTFCLDYVRRGSYSLSAKDVDLSTDIQFAGTFSKILVEDGKNVSGINLVLHRDYLYSLQKHLVVIVALTTIFGVVIVIIGLMWRRRRHVTAVPTGR